MGNATPCARCHGLADPCEACVTAARDPRPEDFETPGPWRCVCGRVYGTYIAGRSVCFVMATPQRRQVASCVRCGRNLAATQRAPASDGVQLEISDALRATPTQLYTTRHSTRPAARDEP